MPGHQIEAGYTTDSSYYFQVFKETRWMHMIVVQCDDIT